MHPDNKNSYEKPADPAVQQENDIMEDLRKSGCPVCNHMEEAVFDYLAKWQYVLANDEAAQREYAAELGFCPAHTWLLAAVASTRGLSRGYPKLLEYIADELLKPIDASPILSINVSALVKDAESCRVCRLLHDTEDMYTRRLATFLEQRDAHEAYARSDGACLRHVSLLVSLVSREIVQFLLSETARHLKEVADNMRRYVLKREALKGDPLNRVEMYAYLRAMVYIAGARNVYAPHIRRI